MSIGGYYLGDHESQYSGSARLAEMGCSPTTGANGADNSTGGKPDRTGDQILALIPKSQETDPSTPGWSLEDVDHAMAKIGVPFTIGHDGWSGVTTALRSGLYVALQGDSDQFGNNTCSGAFNGDHMVGIHPARRVVSNVSQHWIDDPICKTGRWENDYVLHRYASKYNASIRYGVFTHPVPKVNPPPPVQTDYILRIAAGAKIHLCNFVNGCVKSQTIRTWGPKASSAACSAPVRRKTCSGGVITTVRVANGMFAGRVVHLGPGVTATKIG